MVDDKEDFGTWSDPNDNKRSRRLFLKQTAGSLAAAISKNPITDLAVKFSEGQALSKTEKQIDLPDKIDHFLKRYVGEDYEQVSHQELINDVIKRGAICIGEVHAVPEDMKSSWGLIQEIRQNTDRQVVLAFERFEAVRDKSFVNAVNESSGEEQEEALAKLFSESQYSRAWGRKSDGYHASTENFEELITNAANEGIYMFGIDVPRPEMGEVPPDERNAGWLSNLEEAIDSLPENIVEPLVVVIGGGKHMGLQEGSFIQLAKQSDKLNQLGGAVSIQLPTQVGLSFVAEEQTELLTLTEEFIVKRVSPPKVSESEPAYEIPKLLAISDYWFVMNSETAGYYKE
jgi:hypothetical protein